MISLADVQPLDDRILLLRLPPLRDETRILVPQVSQQPSKRGRVVAHGPGRRFPDGGRRPLAVGCNDIVHYQSCDLDDGTYVLIQEGDILGIETDA